jgi:hypothetical protein
VRVYRSAVEALLMQSSSEATTSRSSRSRRVRAISQRSRRGISVSRVVSEEHLAEEDTNTRGAELRRLIVKAACRRATVLRAHTLDVTDRVPPTAVSVRSQHLKIGEPDEPDRQNSEGSRS